MNLHTPESLSIVIPVYNSATILPELVCRLHKELSGICSGYEVILVNDGSRDESWEVVKQLAAEYQFVRGFTMMRNYGQHNALLCGIRAARFPVTITMDDDLQHPPEEIPKLLAELNQGYEVIYGFPEREEHSFLRNIASQMTKIALKRSMGATTAGKASSFRVFHTRIKEAFAAYRSPFVSIDVLLTWGATRFSAIPVKHATRKTGTSNYTFMKLLTHAFNMMTGFSVVPLQMASFLGFACAFFGLLVLIFVIGRYLILGHSMPGFPFLASIISIFSGAQLLALGVMGEYLSRMHFRMMEQPTYVIQQKTDIRDDHES